MAKSSWYLEEVFDLSYLGEQWQGCYLKFKSLPSSVVTNFVIDEFELRNNGKSTEDVRKVATGFKDLAKEYFIEGKTFNGKEVVVINKQAIDEMPITILRSLRDFLLKAQVNTTNTAN